MKKDNLINNLKKLIDKLDNEILSKGESAEIISKINILQSHLQTQQLIENTSHTSVIIKNNKKTSIITIILSVLTIILSIISLFNAFSYKEAIYKDDFKKIIELQTKEREDNKMLINKIDSIKIKIMVK